jgi:hypothetical protein
MATDPVYIRQFKELIKDNNITEADIAAIEAELYGGSDRATGVLLASFVENGLNTFLRAQTRPSFSEYDKGLLFGMNSPLGTFSAKIIAAYSFNWFGPDTRHDLNLIRVLRNGFAHSRNSFTFETPQVAAVCAQLRAPESPGAFIPHGYLSIVTDDELQNASNLKHPRTRFIATCHMISGRLLSNSQNITGVLSAPLDMP